MSTASVLSAELADLQDAALVAADDLANCLQAISDLYWQGCEDAPLFRATKETLESLREIEVMLAVPISEIQSAA